MSAQTETATETRGRPRVGDPGAISDIALKLMAQHGWSATTMQRIATASGISAPTLFRYFPTKADVLWHRLDENAEFFRFAFDERAHRQDLGQAITDSYLAMLLADPDRLRTVKKRIAILARDDDAANASWAKFEQWRLLVTDMVADARQQPSSALPIKIAGAMIWAALWAALSSWSTSEDDDPTPYVATAHQFIAPAVAS